MNSIYNWKYLRTRITVETVLETLLHVIDLTFFKTVAQILRQPSKIRRFLIGESELQGPLSFYLSSLVFVFIISFVNFKLFPESFEQIDGSSDENYAHYFVTVPFIVIIGLMNLLLFRKERLNFLSNLIVALFIIGQSVFYLAFYLTAIAVFDVFDDPMTQASVYVMIIFGNLFIVNLRTFERPIFATLWRSTFGLVVAFVVMIVISFYI
jgi:hypothetical protein